ncbi:MAG: neutral zinc metallopeptidase [Polyangiaceae bacterium]
METEGRRRSTNFEDRGSGGGGGGGGGLPINALSGLVRLLGVKGTLVVGAIAGIGYFVLPTGLRNALLRAVGGGSVASGPTTSGGSVCKSSPESGKACDFSLAVLASTEDVWKAKFAAGALPKYSKPIGAYQEPTLVVFANAVSTGGCGNATSDVGPFYCSGDRKLYIDPSFYTVMDKQLKAPGDFAQAYVIAHEVGHHLQTLIGSRDVGTPGETKNQTSVRMELQADCFAGVWGHDARSSLAITDEDLREAVNAAHQIGDDTLGHSDKSKFTHGSSEQRMRWFKRGFESGDARQCDTFAVAKYAEL